MTIQAYESEIQQSQAIEIYDFTYNTTVYRYTSNRNAITFGGYTYAPLPIDREGVQINSTLDPNIMNIALPATSVLAQLMVFSVETVLVIVKIQRYYSDYATEAERFYDGYSSEVVFADGFCKIKFVTLMDLINYSFPRVCYQALCNNTFGDSICTKIITPADAIVTGVDSSGKIITTNKTISLVSINGFCVLDTTGTSRMINGETFVGGFIVLTIQYPFDGSIVGHHISVSAGCLKTKEQCVQCWNNLANFVGMPYIPIKDSANTPVS